MKMPYGKYKDYVFESLPSGYLYRLATDCTDEDISLAADQEYRFREIFNLHFDHFKEE